MGKGNFTGVRGIDPGLWPKIKMDMLKSAGKYHSIGAWLNDAIREKLLRKGGKNGTGTS